MYKSSSCRTICLAFVFIFSGACDSGNKSKTPADLAADSALRADLALANRDTMLVDSIGRLAPGASALADSSVADTGKVKAPAVAPMTTAPVVRSPSSVVRSTTVGKRTTENEERATVITSPPRR